MNNDSDIQQLTQAIATLAEGIAELERNYYVVLETIGNTCQSIEGYNTTATTADFPVCLDSQGEYIYG